MSFLFPNFSRNRNKHNHPTADSLAEKIFSRTTIHFYAFEPSSSTLWKKTLNRNIEEENYFKKETASTFISSELVNTNEMIF